MLSGQNLIKFNGSAVELAGAAESPGGFTRIADWLSLPVNCYILNPQSQYMLLNGRTAASCGFTSMQDAVGHSIKRVAKAETAECILRNDQAVLSHQRTMVNQEHYTRLDDHDTSGLSIKMPLMANHQVIGLLGMTLLSGSEPLSFANMASFLQPSTLSTMKGMQGEQINGIYFNSREIQVLQQLVLGLTAKEIGRKLGLSHRTIEHHLERMKAKAGCATKSVLIQFAIHYFI